MSSTVKFALQKTAPVMLGYVFLGTAFGILLQNAGFGVPWAFAISLLVYAGSMQFVLVGLLTAGSPLSTVAVMTLLLNSRHIFYGLSFIEKFKKMKKLYPYMVFSLTDETYSVLCSCKYPPGVDEDKASFLIALFNQSYWIAGSVFGAVLGGVLPFDFTGIDFSMTALFTVIFIDQWREYKTHLPAVIGLACSALFLVLLGPDRFLLPSLLVSVTVLLVCKNAVRKAGGKT